MRILKSHSAENSEKRDPLGFLTFVLLQNIEKDWKEDSLGLEFLAIENRFLSLNGNIIG